MDQHSRMAVLHDYKAGKHHVLVATDVAARGLDIKSIKSVVNYDAAKEVDTHVHRIGRTGRAGDKEGVAYTLITPFETRFAGGPAVTPRPHNLHCLLAVIKTESFVSRTHLTLKTLAGRSVMIDMDTATPWSSDTGHIPVCKV